MMTAFWNWLIRRPSGHALRRPRTGPRRKGTQLLLELLEERAVPSVAQPDYVLLSPGGATPFTTSSPTGTTPGWLAA